MSFKRGSLEILNDMLSSVTAGSLGKTRLAHQANLDTMMVQKYLKLVMKLDLLLYDEKYHIYTITENGRNYLNEYNKLLEIINYSIRVV